MAHFHLVSPIDALSRAPHHAHWCEALLSRRTKDVGLHPNNFTPGDIDLRADWTPFSFMLLEKLAVT